MPICNICGSSNFINFNSRPNAMCASCGSLERHRLLRLTFDAENLLHANPSRCLHLAPEACISRYLAAEFGAGYYAADISPHLYPHAQCLKLQLPEALEIFPEKYFRLVVHNHLLEHIPGFWKDIIKCFSRIVAKGGAMAFTVPVDSKENTIEGGEKMTEKERSRLFGQHDHVRFLGKDFFSYMDSLEGQFVSINATIAQSEAHAVPTWETVYVYKLTGGEEYD